MKLPAVLLAMEKINQLNIPGLDKDTPMFTEAGRPEQTAVTTDTTAENGLPSVAHYARKILLASDNDAFNRLYEFIGQEDFNKKMREKGYPGVRIRHRLELPMSPEENRYTNPVSYTHLDVYKRQGHTRVPLRTDVFQYHHGIFVNV